MRPLQFAPISGRRSSVSRMTWWIAPSLGVHAALAIASGAGLPSRDEHDERPMHEVVFLAPLLPKNDPAPDSREGDGLAGQLPSFAGLDGVAQGTGDMVGTSLGRANGTGRGVSQTVPMEVPPAPDPVAAGDDHVFQAVDVDREVQREGEAVAPIYPEQLRLNGVQGGVTVEFVVDTAGHVEEGSLHVIGTTHPLFAVSVREAAAEMRFRPAVRSGRTVRQQVIQSFQFVLQAAAAPPADSTPAVKKKPDARPT